MRIIASSEKNKNKQNLTACACLAYVTLFSLLSVGCDFGDTGGQPSAKQQTSVGGSSSAAGSVHDQQTGSSPTIKSHFDTQFYLKKLQVAVDGLKQSGSDPAKAEWVVASKNSDPSTMTVDCGEPSSASAAFDTVWAAWTQPKCTLNSGSDAAEFKQKILDVIVQEFESRSDTRSDVEANVTESGGVENSEKSTDEDEVAIEYRGFRFSIDCQLASNKQAENSDNRFVVQLRFVDAKKFETQKLKQAEDSK